MSRCLDVFDRSITQIVTAGFLAGGVLGYAVFLALIENAVDADPLQYNLCVRTHANQQLIVLSGEEPVDSFIGRLSLTHVISPPPAQRLRLRLRLLSVTYKSLVAE
jgi:hypothetical protein